MEWKVAPSYQNAKIVKVDEETHKILISETCYKCGGSGMYVIPHAFSGTCFACNGFGKIQKWVKGYTEEEYNRYMKQQARTKERKEQAREAARQEKLNNSEANKKEKLIEWGYDPENPTIYLVVGNTYDIKDYLKEQGCKFDKALNWYSTTPIEVSGNYNIAKLSFFDIYNWEPLSLRFVKRDDADENAAAAIAAVYPTSHSEYVGELKERMRNLNVTFIGARSFDGYYGTTFIYTFKQGENILVWMTSKYMDLEKNASFLLTGTVKDHKEYKGEKQTYLSRCILKEAV